MIARNRRTTKWNNDIKDIWAHHDQMEESTFRRMEQNHRERYVKRVQYDQFLKSWKDEHGSRNGR